MKAAVDLQRMDGELVLAFDLTVLEALTLECQMQSSTTLLSAVVSTGVQGRRWSSRVEGRLPSGLRLSVRTHLVHDLTNCPRHPDCEVGKERRPRFGRSFLLTLCVA